MNGDKRMFYMKLSASVVSMFVSPMMVHFVEMYFKLHTPAMPFLSLGLVLLSMGTVCKLVIDRENNRSKRERRERRAKNK